MEIVKKGFEAILDDETGVKQEDFNARPLSVISIVKHLVTSKLYRSIGKKNP